MIENTAPRLAMPAMTSRNVLTEVLRDGSQLLLGQAIEAEVQGWLKSHKKVFDQNGHLEVVGNRRLPTRNIITGVGPVKVSQRVGGRLLGFCRLVQGGLAVRAPKCPNEALPESSRCAQALS